MTRLEAERTVSGTLFHLTTFLGLLSFASVTGPNVVRAAIREHRRMLACWEVSP